MAGASLSQRGAIGGGEASGSAKATQLRIVFGRPEFQHDKLKDYQASLQAALASGREIPPAQRALADAHIRLIEDYFATQEAVERLAHGFSTLP